MSHLFAILIVAVAHLADRGYRVDPGSDFGLSGRPIMLLLPVCLLMVLAWQWIVEWWCERLLSRRRGGVRALDAAELVANLAPWLIVATYCLAVLAGGWGATMTGAVRRTLGANPILIPHLLTIAPPIIGLALSWAIHYPIVKRLREATLVRAIDEGRTIHPMPGRWRYVWLQARLHLLFLLTPLLLIVAATDAIERWVPPFGPPWTLDALSFGATLVVFVIAPVVARFVLDVRRLPPGDTRDLLLRVCADHHVRVRDVLVWRTHGTMINGAVMGIVGRARYVLLTDALLETLPADQVEAVMAHEVGHVRRRHMPWMMAALFASLMLAAVPVEIMARFFAWSSIEAHTRTAYWIIDSSTIALALLSAFFVFGWVSRRFERQADTFSVQHLSGFRGNLDGGDTLISQHATESMRGALATVCRLNGIDPRRPSWRHGSIRWRQEYLAGLVGARADQLPIDRQVRRIKWATLGAIVLLFGAAMVIDAIDHRPSTNGEPLNRHIAAADSGANYPPTLQRAQ
jgi:Zn-dependent protease with chaperone function